MIYFYSGKPGSGKSLHCAKIIDSYHRKGKHVITNFEVNPNFWEKRHCKKNPHTGDAGILLEIPNDELSVDCLIDFADKNHARNSRGQILEAQTLVVLDECQTLFNSRQWNKKGRSDWVIFFSQHRKFGFTIILVSQDKSMVDRQIRCQFQFDYCHRNLKNFKLFGFLLGTLFENIIVVPVKGMDNGKHDHTEWLVAPKKYYRLYDSYKIFDTSVLRQI